MMTDVRNSDRCIWDSSEEADALFERIKSYIPDVWKNRSVMGLNERLRILRYYPGGYFKPHFDGEYRRENGERSCITIQLYLNEGFEGGETTFLASRQNDPDCPVVPKTGSVLVFEHNILHEGSDLKKGVKYTIRTDVMYSALPAIEQTTGATTTVEQTSDTKNKDSDIDKLTESTQNCEIKS